MFVLILLSLFLVQSATAVIYRLNASEYARMPPVFEFDPYEACLLNPDGLYCYVEAALVSDEPSSLLGMIHDYSAHTTTHLNHSHLRYGRCVTQSCKKFYQKKGEDLKWTLEACLNESLNVKYKLKANVLENYYCTKPNERKDIDLADISVGIICVCILLVNLVGSFCDFFFEEEKYTHYLRYIQCFSLKRNWRKLMLPGHERSDPRLQCLKCFHGVRVLTMGLVIAGHTFLCTLALPENTDFVENLYVTNDFLLGGTLIMQIFLIMSSFLLFYNWLIYSESAEAKWRMLPKLFFLRWIRLAPPYALVLALTATWFQRSASGPMWQKLIGDETADCRQNWWQNMLNINNYYDDTKCMIQTWYLAADTQLFAVALVVLMLCRTTRNIKVILSLLFVLSLLIPAAHTYYQDLDGIFICSPSTALNLFVGSNPTFDHVYKRGHTNLCGYATGITLAYLVYHLQKTSADLRKYRRYRLLFAMLFPLGFFCWCSSAIYLADAPRPPVFVNVLYAALLKPLYGLIVAIGIFSCIFKLEDLNRRVLEWNGWTSFSRLSYCAYLIHVAFVKYYFVSQTSVQTISLFSLVAVIGRVAVLSYTAAFFLWILVEAPFNNLRDECFGTNKKVLKDKYNEQNNGKVQMNGKTK